MKWGVPVIAAVVLAGCAGQPSMDDTAAALMKAAPEIRPVIAEIDATHAVQTRQQLTQLTQYFQTACAESRRGRLYDDSLHEFVVGAWRPELLQQDVLMKTEHRLTDEQAIRIADAYNKACARTVTDVSG